MNRVEWGCVVAVILASFYVGVKTGRGQAWDAQQAVTNDWKSQKATDEALQMCEAGAKKDGNGFWKFPGKE